MAATRGVNPFLKADFPARAPKHHSKVSPDPARVRVSEFGASAIVLEVFAFVSCADWNEFLAVKEDLNLRIAEIVRDKASREQFDSFTAAREDTGLLGIDRACEREATAAAAAAGVGPAVVAYLDEPPTLVTEFLPGRVMTPADLGRDRGWLARRTGASCRSRAWSTIRAG